MSKENTKIKTQREEQQPLLLKTKQKTVKRIHHSWFSGQTFVGCSVIGSLLMPPAL
jgi:hypothetical protein